MDRERTVDGNLNHADEALVRDTLGLLQQRVHEMALAKGWYEQQRSVPEFIALMHSELSEALEAFRELPEGREITDVWLRASDGKPEGFATELADCVIRILDTAEHLGIDLASALLQKHAHNATRPHRHGGKRC